MHELHVVIEGRLAAGASRSLSEAIRAVRHAGGELRIERIPVAPVPSRIGATCNEWRIASTHEEVALFVIEALKRLIQ